MSDNEKKIDAAIVPLKKIVTIAVASDQNYVEHLQTTIASVLLHIQEDSFLHFYVLDGGISEKSRHDFEKLKVLYSNCTFSFISMKDDFQDETGAGHITRATYFRLKLPSLLPDVDKILYLDCDIIVLKDVTSLYEQSVEDIYALGVTDYPMVASCNRGDKANVPNHPPLISYLQSTLGLKEAHEYINAGILVLNLKKMRLNHIESEFMEMLKTKTLMYMDQDILNSVLRGKIRYLDLRWNMMYTVCRHSFLKKNLTREQYQKIKKAMADPWIIHYITDKKPWIKTKQPIVYKEQYFFYNTILKKILSQDSINKEEIKIPKRPHKNQIIISRIKHNRFFGRLFRYFKKSFWMESKKGRKLRKSIRNIPLFGPLVLGIIHYVYAVFNIGQSYTKTQKTQIQVETLSLDRTQKENNAFNDLSNINEKLARLEERLAHLENHEIEESYSLNKKKIETPNTSHKEDDAEPFGKKNYKSLHQAYERISTKIEKLIQSKKD